MNRVSRETRLQFTRPLVGEFQNHLAIARTESVLSQRTFDWCTMNGVQTLGATEEILAVVSDLQHPTGIDKAIVWRQMTVKGQMRTVVQITHSLKSI